MTHELPYRVLIVDDHFLARQIVGDVMREHNVQEVRTAADGREARDMIAAAQKMGQPYDIVFLDWNMPLIEGIDLLRHFRAQPAFNKTAFIMLTAASEKGEVMQAVKAGATAYIAKPVSKASIGKKFLEVVEWVRKQRIEDGEMARD